MLTKQEPSGPLGDKKNRGNDKQRAQKKGGMISEWVHILKTILDILDLFMKSKTKKVLGVF